MKLVGSRRQHYAANVSGGMDKFISGAGMEGDGSLILGHAPSVPTRRHALEASVARHVMVNGFAGCVACGFTHTLLTPLDLLDARMRTRDGGYRSLRHAFLVTLRHQGADAFATGWAPTLVGYSLLGFARFGLYETTRRCSWRLLGDRTAYPLRPLLYAGAGAAAESVAVAALHPFEAVKVQMQTRRKPATMRALLARTFAESGARGFYAGLGPQLRRRVPLGALRFTAYELALEALYKLVFPIPDEKRSVLERFLFVAVAGYLSGAATSAVLVPADNVAAEMRSGRALTPAVAVRRMGAKRLWKGFGRSAGVTGALTGAQFLVYDAVKACLKEPRPPPPTSR